jgi:hypothetical protein
MSEPEVGTSSGISSGDVLILPERHPACRRHEARLGFGRERENLAGDAKGKGASGCNREAESTDAPERGGLPRSSEEAAVMVVERRGWVIVADVGQLVRREEPFVQWKAAAFARWHEPDEARVSLPTFFASGFSYICRDFFRAVLNGRRGDVNHSSMSGTRVWAGRGRPC